MAQISVPNTTRLQSILGFLQAAEKLKDTLRSGRTAQGRQESTAEHSWRLCLLVMLLEHELAEIDHHRLLKLCIIHDLGEAISGDVPATEQRPDDGRHERERLDFIELCNCLPVDLQTEFLGLFDEYADGRSQEAEFAKGFDKLETILQHQAGKPDPRIDMAFDLTYGRQHTDRRELLAALRALIDTETERMIQQVPSG